MGDSKEHGTGVLSTIARAKPTPKEYGHRERRRVSEAVLTAGWLNTKAMYSLTVLEPEVQNRGVSRTTLALAALGENVLVSAKVAMTKYHRLGRGYKVQDQGAAGFGSW